MSKFKLGDKVWYAQRRTVEEHVVCPDCFGQKALTVIKGDGSQVSIECEGCRIGYEGSQGYVRYYKQSCDVKEITITKVEESTTETRYGFWECYCADEDCMFTNKEDAEKKAEELAQQHNQNELNKINQKERYNRTWSWNAYYHRDCIIRAERDLEYHTKKLSVAKVKAKEDKLASPQH